MTAPRPGSEVREVSKPPTMCTGCSKPECWESGCQNPPAAETPRTHWQPTVASTALAPAPAATDAPAVPPPATPAPTAAPTPAPTVPPTAPAYTLPEEASQTMAKKPNAARGNPQRTLCAALHLAAAALTREEVSLQTGMQGAQLSNALFGAKKQGRVAALDDGRIKLTKAGREWLESKSGGGDSADTPPAEKRARKTRPAAATKRAKQRAEPSTPPSTTSEPGTALQVIPVAERSFRCAVFSDGGFHLAKNGQTIELTPAECGEMQRYLARNTAEFA